MSWQSCYRSVITLVLQSGKGGLRKCLSQVVSGKKQCQVSAPGLWDSAAHVRRALFSLCLSILFLLLKRSWLTMLHEFQVCNIVIIQLCTSIIQLYAIYNYTMTLLWYYWLRFPRLDFSSLWLIHFTSGSLNPLHLFRLCLCPPPFQPLPVCSGERKGSAGRNLGEWASHFTFPSFSFPICEMGS